MKVRTVLYDANVLYPAPLRDLLVRLAMEGLLRARWTDAIHDEWTHNLRRNRPDLTADQLRRTRDLMDRAVRDALVTGFEKHIEDLSLPDPDDRHVLAAAIHAGAEIIVTLNTRDFPEAVLNPHGIGAKHPDDFVASLLDEDPERVCRVARAQRSALVAPPLEREEFIETLRGVGLIETAARLDAVCLEL